MALSAHGLGDNCSCSIIMINDKGLHVVGQTFWVYGYLKWNDARLQLTKAAPPWCKQWCFKIPFLGCRWWLHRGSPDGELLHHMYIGITQNAWGGSCGRDSPGRHALMVRMNRPQHIVYLLFQTLNTFRPPMCMYCVCIGIALNGGHDNSYVYRPWNETCLCNANLWTHVTCYFICVYVFAVYRSSTLFFPNVMATFQRLRKTRWRPV